MHFRNDTDRELVFRQESNFYYLTGCTVPGSFLLAAYQSGTSLSSSPSVDLFIPKAELADMMWSVPPPSLETAKQIHDVTSVDHPVALPAAIDTLLKALPGALFHTLPRNSPLFPIIPAEYPQQVLNADGAVTDAYLLSALHHARLVKDVDEIAAIKKANEISSRAHEVVMRVLGKAVKGKIEAGAGAGVHRPLLPGEWLIEKEAEAEAIFVASCRREGCVLSSIFFQTTCCTYFIRPFLVPCIKRICPSSQLRLVRRHCTIAAMTGNSHGALSSHTTTRTRTTSLTERQRSSTHKFSSLTLAANGNATPPTLLEPCLWVTEENSLQRPGRSTNLCSRCRRCAQFLRPIHVPQLIMISRILFLAILRYHQSWSPLGRRPTHLPPHASQRVPETWHLQVPQLPWLRFVEL